MCCVLCVGFYVLGFVFFVLCFVMLVRVLYVVFCVFACCVFCVWFVFMFCMLCVCVLGLNSACYVLCCSLVSRVFDCFVFVF